MAAVKTKGNGQIVRSENKSGGQLSLAQFVQKHQEDFARVLPKHMSPERMVRLSVSAVRTTRNLDLCTVPSFASALMACSTLGLEPNTPLGHAYLIPFKNNKRGVFECQLIVGYKGLIELMYRSGIVASVKCTAVFEGDDFSYEYGLHPDIVHKPSREVGRWDPKKLTHVYPVVKLRESGVDPIWDVLDRDQIEQRRRRSLSANSSTSPWNSDYIPMAQKTGIRSIATWVPSSAERTLPLQQAVAYEELSERGRSAQAVSALGGEAHAALESMGSFPVDDEDTSDESTVVTEGQYQDDAPEREPGED